jgi:hypothetical protein
MSLFVLRRFSRLSAGFHFLLCASFRHADSFFIFASGLIFDIDGAIFVHFIFFDICRFSFADFHATPLFSPLPLISHAIDTITPQAFIEPAFRWLHFATLFAAMPALPAFRLPPPAFGA